MARFTVDFSPLRTNKNLRFIFISGVVTRFGSALTLVALPFQIKELTNSYIAVGAMGAVEIVPLIIFALWGGVLADSVDRKKMVWRCEAGALLFSALLLGNSLLARPSLLLLYLVAAGFSAVDGLSGPSFSAMLPRLVDHRTGPGRSNHRHQRSKSGLFHRYLELHNFCYLHSPHLIRSTTRSSHNKIH